MPCGGNDQRNWNDCSTENRKIRSLTQMLCRLCKRLEKQKAMPTDMTRLSEWWAGHKVIDARRRKIEAKRRIEREKEDALRLSAARKLKAAGLTKEERRFLRL